MRIDRRIYVTEGMPPTEMRWVDGCPPTILYPVPHGCLLTCLPAYQSFVSSASIQLPGCLTDRVIYFSFSRLSDRRNEWVAFGACVGETDLRPRDRTVRASARDERSMVAGTVWGVEWMDGWMDGLAAYPAWDE
mmetsp:Transcript_27418/g.78922  ORF Transcript_27418/g.78922 Transcript_27418/m.78922 type:complete len:134 (+) Transcript_27418:1604-2005(+)